MRVLITGATGALGRFLAPTLAEAGHRPRLLDLRPSDGPGEIVTGDIRDPETVRAAVDGVDAIVHLAALHGVHLPHWTREDFWTTNVEATRLLYDACRELGVGRVVLASTMGVYGAARSPGDGAAWSYVDDETPTGPGAYYGMTKLLCEQLARYHTRADGISTVALRLGMFFPPPTFARYGFRMLHGGVDIRDVVSCVRDALAHDPQSGFDTFNVFADVPFGREDAARLGTDRDAVLESYWPGVVDDVRQRGLNLDELVTGRMVWRCDKAKDRLGYAPAHRFDDFLAAWRAGDEEHLVISGARWGVPAAS